MMEAQVQKRYEVLAPAGSLRDLEIMLGENADAIYVGLKNFSSRPESADMDVGTIIKAIEICHEKCVPLYVAINANVRQDQMEGLLASIYVLDEAGADAVILSDIGLLSYLSGKLRNAKLHASTLMGVMNSETVRMLKALGVVRIIFYANLRFDEMARIVSAVPDMEYELVAEGGTCFNDIRQCRLPHGSQDGKHILFCRKRFRLIKNGADSGEAKPICEPPTRTARGIGAFMAAGITSYKIEGRTVPAEERVQMVRDLKRNISDYLSEGDIFAYQHYFIRGERRNWIDDRIGDLQ